MGVYEVPLRTIDGIHQNGFIPYLQNNWTLHVSNIVTFLNYDHNLLNQPFNQQTIQPGLDSGCLMLDTGFTKYSVDFINGRSS
jgi:hypothetical protein